MKYPIFRRPAALSLVLLTGVLLAPSAAWAGQCTDARKALNSASNLYTMVLDRLEDEKGFMSDAYVRYSSAKMDYRMLVEEADKKPDKKTAESLKKKLDHTKNKLEEKEKVLEELSQRVEQAYSTWGDAYKTADSKCSSWKKWWHNVEDMRPRK